MSERVVNPSGHILLVEDEKNVGSTLVELLEREGFSVAWVSSVSESCESLSKEKFDLVLLDVGLPDGSGFEVAKFLKKQQPSASLIFLTALGAPEDRVSGLELGAEDYIVKPFHLKELVLRIRNGLKRARYLVDRSSGIQGTVIIGKAQIHFQRFEAEVDGVLHPLTHKEIALLQLFVERRGCVVSRDEILNRAWSEDEYPTPRTVDNFVMRLRRLIERNPEQPQIIKSIRGIGYQLI